MVEEKQLSATAEFEAETMELKPEHPYNYVTTCVDSW